VDLVRYGYSLRLNRLDVLGELVRMVRVDEAVRMLANELLASKTVHCASCGVGFNHLAGLYIVNDQPFAGDFEDASITLFPFFSLRGLILTLALQRGQRPLKIFQ
jgi:hypothetical protein